MPWDPQYWPGIVSFAAFYIVFLISPGPDCAVTIRHSLGHSRITGLCSALGTATSMGMHVTYALLGVGLFVAESYWGFTIVKYAGVLFLTYLGVCSLRAKPHLKEGGGDLVLEGVDLKDKPQDNLTPGKAFRLAFLTDALNPMVLVFFISVFATMVDCTTPVSIQVAYATVVVISGLTWFSIVALTFSSQKVRQFFGNYIHWVERLTGIVLIGLAIKLFFADQPCIS
ncbi:MAG: LysE family transporter [bacterium]|nr:LysE family transporter [bacterium]